MSGEAEAGKRTSCVCHTQVLQCDREQTDPGQLKPTWIYSPSDKDRHLQRTARLCAFFPPFEGKQFNVLPWQIHYFIILSNTLLTLLQKKKNVVLHLEVSGFCLHCSYKWEAFSVCPAYPLAFTCHKDGFKSFLWESCISMPVSALRACWFLAHSSLRRKKKKKKDIWTHYRMGNLDPGGPYAVGGTIHKITCLTAPKLWHVKSIHYLC